MSEALLWAAGLHLGEVRLQKCSVTVSLSWNVYSRVEHQLQSHRLAQPVPRSAADQIAGDCRSR